MIWLVAFLSCVGLICAETPLNDRVIGGSDAKPNTWKWQVSLQYESSSGGDSFYHICGGTLIDGFHVMTAAHCILSMDANAYQVVVGEYNLYEDDGSEQSNRVEKIIVHPEWSGDVAKGNDIAILKLAESVYDNGFVALAELPRPDELLPHGFTCYITGWGLMDTAGNSPSILQVAPLNVVEQSVCSQPDWWGSIARESMVCAGGDGVTSGCQGDSGGPLNCFTDDAWRVHGVVSYGPGGCSYVKKPTVFTRVSYFQDWIYSVLLDGVVESE